MKDIIKKVEMLQELIADASVQMPRCVAQLEGIRLTIEALNGMNWISKIDKKDWQKLKELLDIK